MTQVAPVWARRLWPEKYAAVERGDVPESLIGERLAELMARRAELTIAADELVDQLAVGAGNLPTPDDVRRLARKVPTVLAGEVTQAKKAFLAALIDEVTVGADRTLRPVIKVPGLPVPDSETAASDREAAVGSASVTDGGARVSAYEQPLAPVLPLRRPKGAHRARGGGPIVEAAERLAQRGDGSFSAREVHAELERVGTPLSWPWVRRAVTRRLAGRERSLPAVFVEVIPSRYRFRTEEPVRRGPVEPATPAPVPTKGGPARVPPSGCRAAILSAGAALAARDPEGLFRFDDLLVELRALGYGYVKATVQENLCRMTGRQFAGHRSFDDLERVALGVYRLRPSPAD